MTKLGEGHEIDKTGVMSRNTLPPQKGGLEGLPSKVIGRSPNFFLSRDLGKVI